MISRPSDKLTIFKKLNFFFQKINPLFLYVLLVSFGVIEKQNIPFKIFIFTSTSVHLLSQVLGLIGLFIRKYLGNKITSEQNRKLRKLSLVELIVCAINMVFLSVYASICFKLFNHPCRQPGFACLTIAACISCVSFIRLYIHSRNMYRADYIEKAPINQSKLSAMFADMNRCGNCIGWSLSCADSVAGWLGAAFIPFPKISNGFFAYAFCVAIWISTKIIVIRLSKRSITTN